MVKRAKVRLIVVCVLVLLTVLAAILHPTAKSKFRAFFSDTSLGIPEHRQILEFEQPLDAIQQDYLTTTFTQSEEQFQHLAIRLGVPNKQLLAAAGATVTVQSRIDPDYPWLLTISAEPTNAPEKLYRVKIEGHEPYNQIRRR